MAGTPRGTVLSVCARHACRGSVRRVLESAGFRLVEAESGAEALELIKANPDIVLLGLQTPDVNSFEICRRIKADPATSRIPVVHVCADAAGDEAAEESMQAGAEAYLRRSIGPGVLVSTVDALLRARRLEEERDRLLLSEQVTLRRQLDEVARLSEERFRVALQGSPITVWNQDLDLRYTWVFNLLPGLEEIDPIGKTDEEIFQNQDLSRLLALKTRVLTTGRGLRGEVSLIVEGETRFLDMTLEPLFEGCGEVVGITGAAVDLTDSKRLEAKLRQAQKLEGIGVLAGGIAHDFNNLLTTILGNASLLLDYIPPEHPGRPQLDGVMHGAERAADLTSQLLAYAGKGQFVLESVDLTRLVHDILSLIRSSLPKRVHLHLACKENLPKLVGDGAQLQQLVMNVIINAAEAIGERPGTVRINTGVQEVSQYYIERNPLAASSEIAPGAYVYLEVRDTGCGMDDATRARIFDPFFTTKFTGRGLGLAAVQGIVRSHRGTIELYSAPGRGTTFKILFPTAPRQAEERRFEEQQAVDGSGTILVVDGDDLVRQMSKAVLKKHGYSVLLAACGEQALRILRQADEKISAAFLDIEIGAAALAAELRALRPDLRIVISSGYPESEVLRGFPEGDAPLFIQKPYTSRRLAELARAATAAAQAAHAG